VPCVQRALLLTTDWKLSGELAPGDEAHVGHYVPRRSASAQPATTPEHAAHTHLFHVAA
jgi:hypothetical protein